MSASKMQRMGLILIMTIVAILTQNTFQQRYIKYRPQETISPTASSALDNNYDQMYWYMYIVTEQYCKLMLNASYEGHIELRQWCPWCERPKGPF